MNMINVGLTNDNGLRVAYDSAIAYVSNLSVGDTFLGVKPESEARFTDKLQRSIFFTAALDALRNVRLCTSPTSHKITSITRY